MTTLSSNDERLQLGAVAGKARIVGFALIAIGLATAALVGLTSGFALDQWLRGYIAAFAFGLSICLGGLFWTMIQHATRAGWSVVVRRIAESVAANLKWIWIAFLPILIAVLTGREHVYSWIDHADDPVIAGKQALLNPTMWTVFSLVFLALWLLIARFFHGTSVEQDRTGDPQLTSKMQWFAPACLLIYALSQTLAAVLWIMSLEAHWFSTIFGVYFFAASCCGFFSVNLLIAATLNRSGKAVNEISIEHFQDMGKLLFAFGTVFWAYIAFSQYMLIWYANIPEETNWYLVRQMGGWQWFTIALLVGHFAIPFLLLVTKHTKRNVVSIALIAGWMLLMHAVDMMWLVLPKIPHEVIHDATTYSALSETIAAEPSLVGFGMIWVFALALIVAMAGLLAVMTARTMSLHAIVPLQDPRLSESLAFENM